MNDLEVSICIAAIYMTAFAAETRNNAPSLDLLHCCHMYEIERAIFVNTQYRPLLRKWILNT